MGSSLSDPPHLGPVCLEGPNQGHKAPDNVAARISGTVKPLHHDKVTAQGEDCGYANEENLLVHRTAESSAQVFFIFILRYCSRDVM